MAKSKKITFVKVLSPVAHEIRNLLDMFEFFLTERHMGKPIDKLGESVRDMRIIIGRIMVDYFLGLNHSDEVKFCKALAEMLADRCAVMPIQDEDDRAYEDYCIGEIITSFEYAQEVKVKYHDDPILQKILALDIPVLRPFDYGLRRKMKLVVSKKKKARAKIEM